MLSRSGVDENLSLLGVNDETRPNAIGASSGNLTMSSQADGCPVEGEQTVINKEISSEQQVEKLLIASNEFDDTTKLINDANDVATTKQIINDAQFGEHSSSINYESVVILNRTSYPNTIEGCIDVINKLRQSEKALQISIAENEQLLWSTQAQALNGQLKLDKKCRERKHWETEYHIVNRELRQDDHWRSKSREPTTTRGYSRQSYTGSVNQRRDSSRPGNIMDRPRQDSLGARQHVQDRQGGDRHERQMRSYSRGAVTRRGMQPSFFQGRRGAFVEGNRVGQAFIEENKTTLCGERGTNLGQYMDYNLKQKRAGVCFKCENLGRCTRKTCPATNITCAICTRVGHVPSKCWRKLSRGYIAPVSSGTGSENDGVNGDVDKLVTVKSDDMINNCMDDEVNELFDEPAMVLTRSSLGDAQSTGKEGTSGLEKSKKQASLQTDTQIIEGGRGPTINKMPILVGDATNRIGLVCLAQENEPAADLKRTCYLTGHGQRPRPTGHVALTGVEQRRVYPRPNGYRDTRYLALTAEEQGGYPRPNGCVNRHSMFSAKRIRASQTNFASVSNLGRT